MTSEIFLSQAQVADLVGGKPVTITIAPVASPPVASPPATSTKTAIMAYAAQLKAQGKYFSGQHTDMWPAALTPTSAAVAGAMIPVTTIESQSGENVAMLGVSLSYETDLNSWSPDVSSELASSWWAQGGLVQLTLWMNVPSSPLPGNPPGSTQASASTIHDMATPGTQVYANWQQMLQEIFGWIKTQVAGGNTFILRPWSEQNGSWRWYGAQNAQDMIAIWQQMWQLAESMGLNSNLIWMYNVNCDVGNYMSAYPGDAYVDWVSFDIYYTPLQIPAQATSGGMYESLLATGKPLIFAEMGLGSGTPPTNSVDDTQVETMMAQLPGVIGFCTWPSPYSIGSQNNCAELMKSANIVNLSGLPKGLTV